MSNIKTVSPEKVLTFCLSIINKYTKDEVEVAFDEVAPDIYFIQNKKPQTTFYKQSTHKNSSSCILKKRISFSLGYSV